MKFKRILVLCVLLLFCGINKPGFAGETGKIAGTIIDKEKQEPLPGVNVVITGVWRGGKLYNAGLMGASTDLQGDYYIINVPPGIYNIEASFVGYRTEVREKVKVSVDKTTYVSFELEEQAFEGEKIVVVASSIEKVEVDLTATRQSYHVEETETIAGIDDVGDIISLQADVESGHFRGGRRGEAIYLLNGGTLVNPLDNSQAFEPMTIGLQQVEVYTSGFSAEYGNVQSGVVNMVENEGNDEEWISHINVSRTNAYYKNFGGSVFSPDYLDYFSKLNSDEEWAEGTDPITGNVLWAWFGIHFPENYMRDTKLIPGFPPKYIYPSRTDTLRAAHLIRTLWLQSVRDIGLEYSSPDYRIEFSTGGPVTKNITAFIAARQHLIQPMLPTDAPDRNIQLMSNFVYRLDKKNKIKFSYNLNYEYENDIPGDFGRWFEYIIDTQKDINTSHQFGISWNYIFNKSTFLDFKINQLTTRSESLIDILKNEEYSNRFSSDLNWRHLTSPTGYEYGKVLTSTDESRTKTFSVHSDLNSQINSNNLVKAGIQFSYYDLFVDSRLSASSESAVKFEHYHAYPYEGAFYIQDKLEFEGMIANLGLRYDFYDFNTKYFEDKFSPYRNPNFDPEDSESGPLISETLAAKEESKFVSVLQPRLGIAFPVSDKTVLHLNYGVFTQRAQFNHVFLNRISLSETPNYVIIGNPRLEPRRSITYDAGIVRMLPFGFQLDLSAYLKDVSNLTQYAYYKDKYGYFYYTFNNQEYADIKGFHVSLEKRSGFLKGHIRYNFESDKGKAVSATGGGTARARYYEDEPGNTELPAPEDIYLDYNRLHRVTANLRFRIGNNFGFSILGFKPLAKINVSSTYKFLSGRPFTYDDQGLGLRMNKRTPNEHHLNFRCDRNVSINDVTLTLYLEGFNMFNEQVFNFSEVFGGMSGSGRYTEKYMEDRDDILTDNTYAPYGTSVDAYLLANQPRHYRFGLEIEF